MITKDQLKRTAAEILQWVVLIAVIVIAATEIVAVAKKLSDYIRNKRK